MECDVAERDGIIDIAGETALELNDLLDESKEPDMNEVRRLVKQIVAILT